MIKVPLCENIPIASKQTMSRSLVCVWKRQCVIWRRCGDSCSSARVTTTQHAAFNSPVFRVRGWDASSRGWSGLLQFPRCLVMHNLGWRHRMLLDCASIVCLDCGIVPSWGPGALCGGDWRSGFFVLFSVKTGQFRARADGCSTSFKRRRWWILWVAWFFQRSSWLVSVWVLYSWAGADSKSFLQSLLKQFYIFLLPWWGICVWGRQHRNTWL